MSDKPTFALADGFRMGIVGLLLYGLYLSTEVPRALEATERFFAKKHREAQEQAELELMRSVTNDPTITSWELRHISAAWREPEGVLELKRREAQNAAEGRQIPRKSIRLGGSAIQPSEGTQGPQRSPTEPERVSSISTRDRMDASGDPQRKRDVIFEDMLEDRRQMDKAQDQALLYAMHMATRANPEFAGEVEQLGLDLRFPWLLVERDIEKARHLWQQRQLNALRTTGGNPLLIRMMLDPKFALASMDDTELTAAEKRYRSDSEKSHWLTLGQILQVVIVLVVIVLVVIALAAIFNLTASLAARHRQKAERYMRLPPEKPDP
jgi:hypothetical protein